MNINYVYGPSFESPQTWMAPGLWVATLMVLLPLLLFVPTHLVFRLCFPAGVPVAGGSATIPEPDGLTS